MSDISITPADVNLDSNERGIFVQFGEPVTAGQTVYLNSTDGKYYKSDCDVAGKEQVDGIVISAGSGTDGYGYILSKKGSVLGIGGTTTAAEIYVLSGTAGGIMPASDLTAGQKVCVIGVGKAGNKIVLGITNTDVAHP